MTPASNVCELYVIRHGQTDANLTGILQGQMDSQLDDTGLAQAQAAAERLREIQFDAIFASDLSRAMKTARTIAGYHTNIPLTPCVELREWHLGELQGKRYSDLLITHTEIMNAFKQEGEDLAVPGGESLCDFQQRIANFINSLAAENQGKRLLLVTHGGVMQRMLKHVTGPIAVGNIRPLCGNASLSIFQKRPAGWQLVTWNDIAHLSKLNVHDTLTF